MSAYRFAAFAGLAAACLAGTASAQDFQPKQKGVLMLNVRATGVLTDADGAIKTAVGADSGLKAKVGDDVMPTIGLTYFLTDNLAKPFLDFRIIDIIVIYPIFVSRIVRRIYIDTLDSALILRQQRL